MFVKLNSFVIYQQVVCLIVGEYGMEKASHLLQNDIAMQYKLRVSYVDQLIGSNLW